MANFYGQFIGFGAGGVAAGAPGAGFSAGGTISGWSVVNTIDKHFFCFGYFLRRSWRFSDSRRMGRRLFEFIEWL